ncbi:MULTISPECIES: type VI secretion system baseplate subunit TssE [Caballeronia]|jgi:type VI secretion system protein|uniref:Type VI secretion system baseplate subunit TssE n=1 Tax=Caballeronia novacaledonica TaxID=1544861 RepID=A0AA37I871_9BURK|nr:type VI secretion system baseplate subunit TssE [Caballeronia novacaledonica]GJH24593.1 type VI secretion system baseplate subunit TssE [Caballeronia novacaledonica]
MVRERRLLERIASWSAGEARTNETQVDVLVDSVMGHLSRLLNTRQGSVQIDPQFGVPDFTNLAGTTAMGSTREIEEEIRRMVLRYEPRIKSPRVTLNREETDVLSIRFALEGSLEVDDREIPLRISTTVGANGRVSID